MEDTNPFEIKFLGDLQKLEISEKDVLILKTESHLSSDQQAAMKIFMEQNFPNNKALVLCNGIEFGVISKQLESRKQSSFFDYLIFACSCILLFLIIKSIEKEGANIVIVLSLFFTLYSIVFSLQRIFMNRRNK